MKKQLGLIMLLSCTTVLSMAQLKKNPVKKVTEVKKSIEKAIAPEKKTETAPSVPQTNPAATSGKENLLGNGAQVLEESGEMVFNEDMLGNGIKEMLILSSKKAVSLLGKPDGFLLDSVFKIELPEDAAKIKATLKKMGMGKLVDDAVTSMNRAAENATAVCQQEFVEAIKNMTINEARTILASKDTGATRYMRQTCAFGLTNRIKPIIDKALQQSNATKYWKDLFTNYNRVSKNKINPDLTDYVNTKVMDALFAKIAQEEMLIRQSPGDAASKSLKQILGY